MKKIFCCLLILIFCMFLGCNEKKDEEIDKYQEFNDAFCEVFKNIDENNVTENINLPTEIKGAKITWSSSNENAITSKGLVRDVEEDTVVILSAIFTYNNKTYNFQKELTIKAKNEEFVYISEEELRAYDGTIEISFRVPSGMLSDPTRALVKKFEALWDGKIKVEVVVESGGYDGVLAVTRNDLKKGTAPTMVLGYPEHFAEYYASGWLLDLNEFIKNDKDFNEDDFIESYLEENRIGVGEDSDKLYGLPYNKSTEVLVYNKTIFDAMGYTVPTTWKEVETLSAKILEDCEAGKLDQIIYRNGPKISENLDKGLFYPICYDSTDNAFITMCRQFGGAYTERETIEKGYPAFNNDEVIEGLTYFQTLATKGYFAVAETFGTNYSSNVFKALQCIMTVDSSASVSYNVPDENLFEIGVAPIPYMDANHKYVIQQGTNICILGQSTSLERSAAWQLCKFLTSTETTAEFAMSGFYLPVRKSAYLLDSYIEYLSGIDFYKMNSAKAARAALEYQGDGWIQFSEKPYIGIDDVLKEGEKCFIEIVVNKKNINDSINKALYNLGIEVDYTPREEIIPILEVFNKYQGEEVIIKGQVILLNGDMGYWVQDQTGVIYIYCGGKTSIDVEIGDYVKVTGEKDLYYSQLELKNSTVVVESKGNYNYQNDVIESNVLELANYVVLGPGYTQENIQPIGKFYKISGIIIDDPTYRYTFALKDVNKEVILLLYEMAFEDGVLDKLNSLKGQTVEMVVFYYDYYSTGYGRVIPMLDSINEVK